MARNSQIAAIPTRYQGTQYRSRLEARYAALFNELGWKWTYEPDLGIAGRIPDFLMQWYTPTLIECKPATTLAEVAEHRSALVTACADWLCADVVRDLRALDEAPDAPWDLSRADYFLALIQEVSVYGNQGAVGRRALVAGSQLFIDGPSISIDGHHKFIVHRDHVGLAAENQYCLVCGHLQYGYAASSDILSLWRDAGTKTQWKAPKEQK